MLINFNKMHRLVNNFFILYDNSKILNIKKDILINISNRNIGIRFDQLIIFNKTINNFGDFSYTIYNKDSSKSEECINILACFRRVSFYVYYYKKNKEYI